MLWIMDAHCTYQRGLDIPRLAHEGYSGLIIKATQSINTYSAPTLFETWIRQARENWIIPGAYHWLTNADPIRQAEAYIKRIEQHISSGLILAVDNEDTSNPATINTLRQFVQRVKSLTGHQFMFHYSGAWWAKSHIGNYPLGQLGLIPWDSRYVSGSDYGSVLYEHVSDEFWVPGYGGWPRSKMLQFTSHGTAGGIIANADINAFDGTILELQSIATGGVTEMTPEQEKDLIRRINNIDNAWFYDALDLDEIEYTPGGDGQPINGAKVPNRHKRLRTTVDKMAADIATLKMSALTQEQLETLIKEIKTAISSTIEQKLSPVIAAAIAAIGSAADAIRTLDD